MSAFGIDTSLEVAPCAGAWVEMMITTRGDDLNGVAPCAGAWVEMSSCAIWRVSDMVAPCAGAWVEMQIQGAFLR